jgi:hypothetical protein
MADLVAVLGVPHNPLLYRVTRGEVPDDIRATVERFAHFEQRLRDLAVDTIVIIGSDHFRRFRETPISPAGWSENPSCRRRSTSRS